MRSTGSAAESLPVRRPATQPAAMAPAVRSVMRPGASAAGDVDQSPRMVAQRRMLKALGAGHALPVQLTKEQHAVGDLHYGVSDPRYQGAQNMDKADPGATPTADEDPVSVDALNAQSALTAEFTRINDDYVYGYHNVIGMLEKRPAPSGSVIPPMPMRWLDFLKQNIDYLKLDRQVQQVKANAPAPETKDKLNKNGPSPTGTQTLDGKRSAIVEAFDWGSVIAAGIDSAYVPLVNGWTWDAFFRRTSKLGIKFTVEQNKVVHFNTDAPGNLAKGRPDSRVDVDAASPARARQPITHSEMRYVNRTGLVNGPHVDAYHGAANVNAPRTGNEGRMTGYVDNRRLAGKVDPKPL